jgi:hypothetical protein
MKWLQVVQDQIYWQALILIVFNLPVILSDRVRVVSYSGIIFYEYRRGCGKWVDLARVLLSDRLWC